MEEVVGPVVERLTTATTKRGGKGLEAKEIEALSMIRKGFEDLAEGNPALAWKLTEELLGGINEYVFFLSYTSTKKKLITSNHDSNALIRQSLSSSLLPFSSSPTSSIEEVIRKSTIMTDKGLAVLVPTLRRAAPPLDEGETEDDQDDLGEKGEQGGRSPIAQMLYTRWVLNLREQCESLCAFFSSATMEN